MEDRVKELIEILKRNSSKNDNKYTLLNNNIEFGRELAIVLSKSEDALRRYYPEKKYEVIKKEVSFDEIITYLEELNLTYEDIILIQRIPFEDFMLFDTFLNYNNYTPQLILEYKSRIEQNNNKKKVVDKVCNDIDNASNTYNLSALDELCLEDNIDKVREYAKSKDIEIEYEKI